MRIGIIGSGKIGATTAQLLVDAGHLVAIANSRGAASLEGLVEALGENARTATPAEAARFGEVVLLAIPFGAYEDLPVKAFDGKVVIDAGNYHAGRDGQIEVLERDETTSSEELAERLSGARVVKAFNTMYFETLASQGDPDAPREERLSLFVAGDDDEAKEIVSGLIGQIGFAAVDTGSLAEGGRRQQPGAPVYNQQLNPAEAEEVLAQ